MMPGRGVMNKQSQFVAGCIFMTNAFADDNEIGAAIAQGASYLRQMVSADRYHLDCRASDDSPCPVHATGHVFAGFFIADAIGDMLSALEKNKITNRMDAEERDGVWGYMPFAPVDSDDTAFVMRTYRKLGKNVATDSLMRFFDKDSKGFTTFDGRGRAFLAFKPSLRNNFGLHPEVNANIFTLLADSPFCGMINEDLVIGGQTLQGYWHSYFYPGRYYATYMNLRFLCKTGRGRKARSRGIAFFLESQNPDGSWGNSGGVYETALALNALAVCGIFNSVFWKGIAQLLQKQTYNGSWLDERVVIWEYLYSDNPPIVWRAYDTEGVVATALAVKALRFAPIEK
jgi:hypothetical protein